MRPFSGHQALKGYDLSFWAMTDGDKVRRGRKYKIWVFGERKKLFRWNKKHCT